MTSALIGRAHPAAVLHAEISRVTESHGGLVLITGEAGIGKTTLVSGAADEAKRQGALVLSGTCWESAGAPGYWPWVQVIRALRRGVDPGEWDNNLSVLLGEAERTEPFQLFDAVTTGLVAASQRQPVMVVLEDLHWADTASLKLLEFAAQHTWFERLLLVCTYRDVEVEAADHPLRSLMTPLLAKATTVTLTGLGRDEVGVLMARTAGCAPDAELVAEVHRRTGGNPFFVEQTARLWHSGGSVTAIAPGVRDALQRRLAQLPDQVVRLLTDAAVLGREFHRQVLAATAAAPVPHVDRLLDQAVNARLVVVLGGGRFSFTHDLVREALYDETDPSERHAAVVRALDRSPALVDRVPPADLARHAYLAGDHIEAGRVVEYLVAAAKDANTRWAVEESTGHYRRALERGQAGDPRKQVLIGLGLGEALHHIGERDEAWQVFEDAATLARELDEPMLLARVALILQRNEDAGDRAELKETVLRDAYARLGGGDATQSLYALAQEVTVRIAMMARDGDDDETLAFSLWARHDAIWGPGTATERLALTEEMTVVARRTPDPDMEYFATSLRWVTLVELGDPGYLEVFTSLVAAADRVALPTLQFMSLIDRSIINTFHGHFEEAHAQLDESLSHGEQHPGYLVMAHHMRWAFLLLQNRFDEIADLLGSLGEELTYTDLLAGIAAVQRGDVTAAARHLADLRISEQHRRMLEPLRLRFEAQLAAATKDPEHCERVRAQLLPYRGQWAVACYGCDISGPYDLWLGLLDLAQERWDDAAEKLTAAAESAGRMRAQPWEELARRHLGEVRRTSAPANEFRRDGAVWSLGFDGHTIHLPDSKGLHDLHQLLSRPGTAHPAVSLLAPEAVPAARLGGDDVLDDEAKRRYRQRLALLDNEIDRATELGDDNRAAALDDERAALLDELRTATGLGGRSRRLGDEAERARKTVTARIRDALRKIDERHPGLAAYLRATVSTGATCVYQPDPEAGHFRL